MSINNKLPRWTRKRVRKTAAAPGLTDPPVAAAVSGGGTLL